MSEIELPVDSMQETAQLFCSSSQDLHNQTLWSIDQMANIIQPTPQSMQQTLSTYITNLQETFTVLAELHNTIGVQLAGGADIAQETDTSIAV